MSFDYESVNELVEKLDRSGLPPKDRDAIILKYAQDRHRMGTGFAERGNRAMARTYFRFADEALNALSGSSLLNLSKEYSVLRKSLKAERDKLSRTHPSSEPLRPDLAKNVAILVRGN